MYTFWETGRHKTKYTGKYTFFEVMQLCIQFRIQVSIHF